MSEPVDVFVSYASRDRERVLPIVERLEAAGVKVWIDREGISGGASYALEIAEAIEQARAILLMCSEASLSSRNVKQEIALGWRFEKPYLPLLLEPVEIPKDVAYWLEAAQWVEVLDRPESEWMPKLAEALARLGIDCQRVELTIVRDRPLLVGREREQADLRERLSTMLAGRGSVILVGGDAGIGKTTLVEDLSVQAEEQGALILWGHAYDLSVTPPYGPWPEIFERYRDAAIGGLPSLPGFIDNLEELAKVGSQDALFSSVASFIVSVSLQRPLLLVLDDLHWADQSSLDFFRVLARQIAEQRVVLVATYRTDEVTRRHPLSSLLPLLIREAGAERLELRPLSTPAQRSLIERRYALSERDAERLERFLGERAEGNAFYAGELLRTLEDEGALRQEDDRWVLGNLEQIRVPAILRQVIEARVGRLDDESQRLLGVAAVIGQTVPLPVWAEIGEVDEDDLLDLCERSEDARLLEGMMDADAVRFNHALIREALYEGIPSLRRRRLHRQVGEALATTTSPDPDTVAYHFQVGGDPRAVDWLVKAGDRAQRAYAWRTAVERFDAAFAKLSEQSGPDTDRAILLYRIARLERYFDSRRAVAMLADARQLAIEAGEPGLSARCLHTSGFLHCFLGDVRRGHEEMAQADAEYRALTQPQQTQLWALLGLDADAFSGSLVPNLSNIGRFAEAIAIGERIIAETPYPSLRIGQGESGYADALLGMAFARAFLGQAEPARDAFARASSIYQTIEYHEMVVALCRWQINVLQLPYFTDDVQELQRLVALGDASGRQTGGESLPREMFRYHATGALVLSGSWKEAREITTEWAALDIWLAQIDSGPWRALLARNQGHTDVARAIIEGLIPNGSSTEPGVLYAQSTLDLQRIAAALALDAHDLSTARAWLEAHDRWLVWFGAVLGKAEGALGWAQYHHAEGDTVLARQHAEQSLAHASEPRQPLALLAVHRFLGQLDTEGADVAAAEAHLGESLRLADACAAPFERALTLLEIARLRIALGQSAEANAVLTEVRSICEPLEAKPTLARVAELEQRLAGTA